jgi:hypothetical protein
LPQATIIYDKKHIRVNLFGSDHKSIPSLLNALNHNEISQSSFIKDLDHIDLLGNEAILYTPQGFNHRVPIF